MSSQEENAKARAAMEALVGQVIDRRYRLDALLGLGGMGAVYRATHCVLTQEVAVKIMRHDVADDQESRTRFLREAQTLATLRSPHIARVADAGELPDGSVYFVMELLEGEDLLSRVKRHTFTPAETIAFAFQVCAGLREAHAHGIVHRDLKPSNIFFAKVSGGSEVVKILDFGIAKRTQTPDEKLTSSMRILGSPSYMAPEQISNSRDVDARVDIWSFGVVLYGMLAGRLPFGDTSLTALLLQIINKEPDPLPDDVPIGLRRVVAKALAKKADDRFATVEALEEALVLVGGDAPSTREMRVAAPATAAGPAPSLSPTLVDAVGPAVLAVQEQPTRLLGASAAGHDGTVSMRHADQQSPVASVALEHGGTKPAAPPSNSADRTVRTRLDEPPSKGPVALAVAALLVALVAIGVAAVAVVAMFDQRRVAAAAAAPNTQPASSIAARAPEPTAAAQASVTAPVTATAPPDAPKSATKLPPRTLPTTKPKHTTVDPIKP